MPDLSNAINNMLNGRIVRVGHLVEFQFSQPKYVWNGDRQLEAGGKTWEAFRRLGSIEGLEEEADNLQSTELKFVLSGVDSALLRTAVSEDRSTYVGKLVIVWLCFFDEEWQVIEDPIAFKAGIMDRVEVSLSTDDNGVSTRRVSLTAQNIFYGRSIPPYAYYTARDQQLRHPGDRGLEFVNELIEKVIPVPW